MNAILNVRPRMVVCRLSTCIPLMLMVLVIISVSACVRNVGRNEKTAYDGKASIRKMVEIAANSARRAYPSMNIQTMEFDVSVSGTDPGLADTYEIEFSHAKEQGVIQFGGGVLVQLSPSDLSVVQVTLTQ